MKICLTCQHRFESPIWECPQCQTHPPIREGMIEFASALKNSSEGFDPTSFSRLFQLESKNFWFRARNRLIIQTLRHFFPEIKTFLEIGCGTGYVLDGIQQAYPESTVAGSEIAIQGLHYAQQRIPAGMFFQMDARQIPFDQEFDVIGAFDVLEHIQEDKAVLQQIHQAVKRNGGIILTVPQHQFLWGPNDI